jgi:gliding motility-associated-like protein
MKLFVLLSLSILQLTDTFGQKRTVAELQFGYYVFIENIGQYVGTDLKGSEKATFFYKNNSSVTAFFLNGFTIEDVSNKGGCISFYFDGCNTDVELFYQNKSEHYYTFNGIQKKAYAYKKIIFKNLYPNIDLVYSIRAGNQDGFEYSFVLNPGADASKIKIKYQCQNSCILKQSNGALVLNLQNTTLSQTAPLCFYQSGEKENIRIEYRIINSTIEFDIKEQYNKNKTIIIDPFISSAASLTGTNSGVAKDIDYDYDGNIFVAGGGSGDTPCQLAKYDAAGNLLWVFNGITTNPAWSFGPPYGGWAVEKNTGKIYVGQGYGPLGFRLIRLDENGIYDNYISDPDLNLSENWKMVWHCNNGNPQLYVAGGSSSSRNSFGLCSPPSAVITNRNLTNNGAFNQDIADVIFDPATNDMYSIFASSWLPVFINNRIYKHRPPYTNLDIAWQRQSGYTSLREARNRPYLVPDSFGTNDNSANLLAINPTYLFYWDGKFLAAYNKATSANVLMPFSVAANFVLFQGGVHADECNNVFIGSINGTIKVLHLNGTSFDDAAKQDITIPGYPASSVYDLLYDEGRKLLYACGNGFVASIDISGYCNTNTNYNLLVTKVCINRSVQVTLNPAAPQGTVVTYALTYANTQTISNTSGLFGNLNGNDNYTIKAFFNQTCGGQVTDTSFNFSDCPLNVMANIKDASCGLGNGVITASVTGGTAPFQYSKDGINFQDSAIFKNLLSGTYTITVRDANNTTAVSQTLTLQNIDGPQITAVAENTTCGNNNGKITAAATGGTGALQYSIDDINFQPSGFFTNLSPGNYTVIVKDSNLCRKTSALIITPNPLPVVSAVSTPSNCTNNSGSITATASQGNVPYTFSIDGNQYAANPVFTGLAPGEYTVYVKDSSECIDTTSITIGIINNVSATIPVNAVTICEGSSITVQASSDALQFSWSPSAGVNDTTLLNPAFSPANTTVYTLKAVSGYCEKTASITINVNAAPVANAGKDTTVCYGKNIELNGTGGTLYEWQPAGKLSAINIANPVTSNLEEGNEYFLLTVTDNDGCRSLQNDTVIITVSPEPLLRITGDTNVAINQPFQLGMYDINNNGFTLFEWSPPYGLSSTFVASPVAILDRDITYSLIATTPEGCRGQAEGLIKVFEKPEIYVPTAFSPNNDGKNDIIRAMPFGIKSFNAFTIYNRFGQVMFSAADPLIGWNGFYKNTAQPTGTYIWTAEAIDFKGRKISKKGYLVLIR